MQKRSLESFENNPCFRLKLRFYFLQINDSNNFYKTCVKKRSCGFSAVTQLIEY